MKVRKYFRKFSTFVLSYFRTKVVIYLLYLRTTTTTVQATKIDTKVLSYFEGTFVQRCTRTVRKCGSTFVKLRRYFRTKVRKYFRNDYFVDFTIRVAPHAGSLLLTAIIIPTSTTLWPSGLRRWLQASYLQTELASS